MHARQFDRKQYFDEQAHTTRTYVIPYLEKMKPMNPSAGRVLEIGCGEGGNLLPFLELGFECVGVDLTAWKIEKGNEFFEHHPQRQKLQLICQNIYDYNPLESGTFDWIILRDTIEHIPNQERLMAFLKNFLSPQGLIFFAFPPWRMPFGGHQQICHSRWLSKLPYFHLLPRPLYASLLRWFQEPPQTIIDLMEIEETRISIQRFHAMIRKNGYICRQLDYYLINPNYQIKFGLKPRLLPFWLNIPWIRDFYTTAVYAAIGLSKDAS